MSKKQNPLLAAYEAKLEAKYRQKLEINSEFDLMALMLTVSDELSVGPGRAAGILNAFLANKMEIARTIDEDWGPDKHTGDKQLLHTKATLAQRMREIFGDRWSEAREWFPFLWEYWEEE